MTVCQTWCQYVEAKLTETVSFMDLAEFPTLQSGSIETREHQLAPSYSVILKQKALEKPLCNCLLSVLIVKIPNKSLYYQHIRHFTENSVFSGYCRPLNILIPCFSLERE